MSDTGISVQETAATNSPGSRLEEVETETAAEHGERVEGRRQMLRNCAFLVGIIASQVVRTSTLVHIILSVGLIAAGIDDGFDCAVCAGR